MVILIQQHAVLLALSSGCSTHFTISGKTHFSKQPSHYEMPKTYHEPVGYGNADSIPNEAPSQPIRQHCPSQQRRPATSKALQRFCVLDRRRDEIMFGWPPNRRRRGCRHPMFPSTEASHRPPIQHPDCPLSNRSRKACVAPTLARAPHRHRRRETQKDLRRAKRGEISDDAFAPNRRRGCRLPGTPRCIQPPRSSELGTASPHRA